MDRVASLNKIKKDIVWDVVVIGGGATGLGCAVDSASRGFKTLLLEQSDFAKGTSSRSTKLVHGGVRYLAQGDISLVLEALKEMGRLRKNAPHLVSNLAFIIPNYDWWGGPFYAIGMKVYDMMSGKLGLGPSERIATKEVLSAIPNLKKQGLNGGVIYYDGQFDDARLAVCLAQTVEDNQGVVINYMKVTALSKDSRGILNGVVVSDEESGDRYEIKAKSVINATGVFADQVLMMDEPENGPTIVPSQGVHLVLDKEFLQGDSAIMIPKTDDGRVLFAVPWHGKVIVGTTDTPVKHASLEPRASEEEIEFILSTASDYLTHKPTKKDVLSVFAGLRPLVAPKDAGEETKEISRGHKIIVSLSGLVSVVGGKWTIYRKMAEDAIDKAIMVAGLEDRASKTVEMPIHGYTQHCSEGDSLRYYGSDARRIRKIISRNPEWGELLIEGFPFLKAEVIWAVREEMARTVEDFLARRIRLLLLDARASIKAASTVAELMAQELGLDNRWVKRQVKEYSQLASEYVLVTVT